MTAPASRPRVVILGGGMGALATAFELTQGRWQDRLASVIVYQRGWRLGGKGASSRGVHGRIEEHGLHVLLGYYDQTFRLMRACYDELERAQTDPECAILTWDDAVEPSHHVGVMDRQDDTWDPWVATFAPNAARPGDDVDPRPLGVTAMVTRSIELLLDFHRSLVGPNGSPRGRVELSASSHPRPAADGAGLEDLTVVLRGAGLTALAGLVKALEVVGGTAGSSAAAAGAEAALGPVVRAVRDGVAGGLRQSADARRTFQLVDLVLTNLRGVAADGLLTHPDGFGAIDDDDYRDWLRRHGASPETLDSPLLRGLYDLVFAYEEGDPGRPRFSAGIGLQLATRMFLDYKGAIFWRMRAGMGEVIFAPLYEVLRRRGVTFRFFHRVDELRLDEDGTRLASIELGRQADLAGGRDEYEPLVRVKGLPCWPAAPLAEQLADPARVARADLESWFAPTDDTGRVTLRAGEDFDVVVFGISLGMVPHVASELVARHPRWQAMVDHVGTVATQTFQLWLDADQRALGWRGPDRVTVSGYVEPFDTWASMGHLIEREEWPPERVPAAIAYFCNALADGSAVTTAAQAEQLDAQVAESAVRFLRADLPRLLPGTRDVTTGDFRWELLCDGADRPIRPGSGAFAGQYWRANVDPSDLYVQSLPGTDRFRLAPGEAGIDHLVLAGDWTACGLNAGCLEAAARSGVLAAEAVAAASTAWSSVSAVDEHG